MNIFLIGATGYVGSAILTEALARGHQVTAMVRDTGKLPEHASLNMFEGDATHPTQLAHLAAGQDVVITAYNPGRGEEGGAQAIVDGVKLAGVERCLVVGGAGTLTHPAGGRVIDQPGFPAEWKPGAQRTAAFLDDLREERQLDWVFLSPSATLVPGERTGSYRVGADTLLVNAHGESRISLQDYAVAMLDEAEQPRHHRQRFTVGY